MDVSDTITPLTPAEKDFVARVNAGWTREQVLGRLKTDLQTAIEGDRRGQCADRAARRE